MLGLARSLQSWQKTFSLPISKHLQSRHANERGNTFSRFGCENMQEKGLENVTVSDVLLTKGEENVCSWISCQTNDTIEDAMKNMALHNIGSLVVLKPGEQQHIAGIITERGQTYITIVQHFEIYDYMRKIIGQERSSKYTRVAEIMTEESKLITVTPDTSILQAMKLMTDNHIRHVPVINQKIVGMLSIVDVVRAVVEQQAGELNRMNEFIKGKYY